MKGALVLALLGTIVLVTEARFVKNRQNNLKLSLARLLKQDGPPPPTGGPPPPTPLPEDDESSTKIYQVLRRLHLSMKQGPGGGPGGPGGPPPCELAVLEECEGIDDDLVEYITGVIEDASDLSPIETIISAIANSADVDAWIDAGWDEDNLPNIAEAVCPGSGAGNDELFWHIVGTGAALYASQGYTCAVPTECPTECPTVDNIMGMTACLADALVAEMIEPDMVRAGICFSLAGGPGGASGASSKQVTKEELLTELKKYLMNQ